ncbi:uncharacterized protein METZ01_LOCUS136512 [marine metagenome]|uniref:Uncharacterized protein n=1 Tax=marine metagenome TaxID=408172 RepID=A0A381Z2Z8_9ZZZZ
MSCVAKARQVFCGLGYVNMLKLNHVNIEIKIDFTLLPVHNLWTCIGPENTFG